MVIFRTEAKDKPIPNKTSMMSIKDFYNGSVIFLTGATGFVGKALLEKLLRSCPAVDTIYVLARSKYGVTYEKRVQQIFNTSLFENIRTESPQVLEKVRFIEGDVRSPDLGISETDRIELIGRVSMVFHSAASVKFNESLKQALTMNTMGTLRIVELCKEIKQLKSFVYVSTAYSNAEKREVDEVVYETRIHPNSFIDLVFHMPDDALEDIKEKILNGHPNTYTFSKSLAEQIVLFNSDKIPSTIVRPSIVTGSWKEPVPGWVDNMVGINGFMTEIGLGTISSIKSDGSLVADMIPVDVVVNTLITAAWQSAESKSNTLRVYNCTSGSVNPMTWAQYMEYAATSAKEYPSKRLVLNPGVFCVTSKYLYWVCLVLLHFMPALLADAMLMVSGRKARVLQSSVRYARAHVATQFFSMHGWNFHVGKTRALAAAVRTAADGADFGVDISSASGFSWPDYVRAYMLGIRTFVLHDDMSTLPAARARLAKIFWTQRILTICGLYVLMKYTLSFINLYIEL